MPSLAAASASQLPLFHIVGFTGHRQIANPELIGRAIGETSFLSRNSRRVVVLSSVAEGSDQPFVCQCCNAGCPARHPALPHEEFARDHAGPPARKPGAAGQAEHLQIATTAGPATTPHLDCGMEPSTVRPAAGSGTGRPARGKGGTAEVIEYARSIGRPILIIDALTGEPRQENWSRLDVQELGLTSLNRLPEARTWGDNPFAAPDEVFAFQQKCDFEATRSAPGVRRMTSRALVHVLATMIAASLRTDCTSRRWHGQAVCLPRSRHCCGAGFIRNAAAEMPAGRGFCRSALATWDCHAPPTCW
jgi:hypothetical protein